MTDTNINLATAYAPSENVVAREIEGEIIIVPLVAGIGDADDELYTLSSTGQAIWQKLDGQRTLNEVVVSLMVEFNATQGQIEADILGFVKELVRRGILVACG